jgi:FlaA1/EpsC-like NDP-sugar epimerase
MRGLRRLLYEIDHRLQPLPSDERRRILIVGAGLSGLGIASEIRCTPHLDLVGFVDDDPAKQGCAIAGYPVLGPSNRVYELVHERKVSDVIVCAKTMPADLAQQIQERSLAPGVQVHIVPSLDLILRPEVLASSVNRENS